MPKDLIGIRFLIVFQDRDEQTRLEMKHRKEEDDLYRKFAHHREEEDRRIREEFRVSKRFADQAAGSFANVFTLIVRTSGKKSSKDYRRDGNGTEVEAEVEAAVVAEAVPVVAEVAATYSNRRRRIWRRT